MSGFGRRIGLKVGRNHEFYDYEEFTNLVAVTTIFSKFHDTFYDGSGPSHLRSFPRLYTPFVVFRFSVSSLSLGISSVFLHNGHSAHIRIIDTFDKHPNTLNPLDFSSSRPLLFKSP